MSIQELREMRAALATEMRALAEKTEFDPATDQAAFDRMVDGLNAIDARIANAELVNQRLAGMAERDAVAEAAARVGHNSGSTAAAVFARWLRGGDRALSAEDHQVVMESFSPAIRNAMSTTTGAEGGFTVATEVAASVVDRLKAYGGMRSVATILATEMGNPMSFPTSDGTAEEGEIVAENALATDLDPSFGTTGLPVYKFSSKAMAVPFELLQDASVDVEAFVTGRMVTRLGRITNRMFTTGTGVSQPNGIAVAATVGITAANGSSQVTAVKYESLVDLQHSVDAAYREQGNCRFMMSDNTLARVRKILDASGRPIFVPGYEMSVPGGAPDRLLGAPVAVNYHMPDMAAGAQSIAYGDFSGYYIRDVLQVQMFRFTDSAYTKRGQIGFLAWLRSGGNLIDTGAVRLFKNAAT